MAIYINRLNGGNIVIGSGGGGSSGHADTWYKYANDTEWRTISISGAIEGNNGTPTTQIPNVLNVVALEIGTNVTSIGNHAFYECTELTSVTIPDGVTSIGDDAFWRCSDLTGITIPDSVTSIGECAFVESNIYQITALGFTVSEIETINENNIPFNSGTTITCSDGTYYVEMGK